MKKAILISINVYKRFLSPFLPPACRFSPTCSQYSYEAICKYGVLRGTILTLRRLIKCHPFHAGGHDPLV
ncbi:MAG: membrane protein insertion efficiency factor YidD [Acidobacteria bacterium]|nr:MAG: membrane protein insertion efficiency factor YidD [Acidobacteriota bacterium]